MTDKFDVSQLIMGQAPARSSLENHDDISSDEDDYEPPILQTVTKEELRLARVQKRSQKKAEKHAKAEVFRRMGDELYSKEKFEEAYIPYLEATQIWPSNASYYIKLSMTYAKLGWFEEAAHASTRALSLDPKSHEARYLRGVARLEQRLLRAAKTDLEIVTEHDPNHTRAVDALKSALKALEAGTRIGNHTISPETAPETDATGDATAPAAIPELDFSYPHYDDAALEVDTLSNTSDCNHRGNGVPCRFYNRAGCAKGSLCPFSHAPDEKSVRDDLGRNVCTYFLLDTCKFGAPKCVYSHSRVHLPTNRGWWNSAEQTAKVKTIVEMSERAVKERRSMAAQLQLLQRRKLAKERKTAKTPATAKGTSAQGEADTKDGEEKDKVAEETGEVERRSAAAKSKGTARKLDPKTRKSETSGKSRSQPKQDASTDEGKPTPASSKSESAGETKASTPLAQAVGAENKDEPVAAAPLVQAPDDTSARVTAEFKVFDEDKGVEVQPDAVLSH